MEKQITPEYKLNLNFVILSLSNQMKYVLRIPKYTPSL